MIALNRMRGDLRTQAYVARRTTEGKSKREIIRCLKRYMAREVYGVLAVTRPKLVSAEEDLVSPAQVLENGSNLSR